MDLVIKIDENVFTRLFDNGTEDYAIMNDDLFAIAKAIRKGTPLPKGHGRIIDYGYVVDAIDDWINAGEYGYTNATDYLRNRVNDVPTIIEGSDTE